MNRKLTISAAVLAGLVALAIAGGAVFAQTSTPGTGNTAFNYAQAFEQALAKRLGITTDTLTADYKAAAKDVVAQEVQQGKLTQAQADQLNQRIDQGQGFGPFGFGGLRGNQGAFGRGLMGERGQVLQAVATALNMPLADLTAQLQAGKTIADVAASKNVPLTQVQTAVVNAISANIDQAVTNGTLTAAQAAQMKQALSQNITNLLNGQNAGFKGGFGGRRGRFNGQPNANPQNGQPNTHPQTAQPGA